MIKSLEYQRQLVKNISSHHYIAKKTLYLQNSLHRCIEDICYLIRGNCIRHSGTRNRTKRFNYLIVIKRLECIYQ